MPILHVSPLTEGEPLRGALLLLNATGHGSPPSKENALPLLDATEQELPLIVGELPPTAAEPKPLTEQESPPTVGELLPTELESPLTAVEQHKGVLPLQDATEHGSPPIGEELLLTAVEPQPLTEQE